MRKTNDMDDSKVIIVRSLGDHNCGTIHVSEIKRVHWDNQSGGVNKRSGAYALYGYIPYSLAMKIGIRCSGRHDFGGNEAKICIPPGMNKGLEYISGYEFLCESAGKKPISIISQNRPDKEPPCTKKILKLLTDNEILTRGELRSALLKLGYKSNTILNALRTLTKKEEILLEGSSNSPYQKIRKNPYR